MAHAAVIPGRDVNMGACRTRLAGRYTGVVTRCTVVGINTKVIECDTGKGRKIVGDVTRRAVLAGRHMARRLAQGDVAVMTHCTVVDINALVTERGRNETGRAVAHVAFLGCWQVVQQLARRDRVVMAR